MMVIYDSGNEVLVCELSHEDTLKKEYFEEGGRDYDEYDRSMVEGTIEINTSIKVWADRTVT